MGSFLLCDRAEGKAAALAVLLVDVFASTSFPFKRLSSKETQVFDNTLGHPGEDICVTTIFSTTTIMTLTDAHLL